MGVIYKPETYKGPVLLLPEDRPDPPKITLADGQEITAVKAGTQGAGGIYDAPSGHQWVFPRSVLNQQGATLTVGDQTQVLNNTNLSYRGDTVGSLGESLKGAIGSGVSPTVGNTGGFGIAGVGAFGIAPQFIGNLFPEAVQIPDISQDYQFIDPIKFAETYSPFLREEVGRNLASSRQFALDTIETELAALTSYIPRSAALARGTIAEDNIFNQLQRLEQLRVGAPGVIEDLATVEENARAYARGEVPDDVTDRALELGVRSAAADASSYSGFGARSSVARKSSDLLSAERRIQLSQYGQGLLSENASQRAQLLLAPTQYSTAGAQVPIAPSISGSQLQRDFAAELDALSIVPATAATENTIGQQQYVLNLRNAVHQFNANALNNFALSYFNYLNSYVNSLAGAGSVNLNTGIAFEQQQEAFDRANDAKVTTQKNNTVKSGISAGGHIIGAIAGLFGSDEMLKEDIEDYEQGLEDVLKVRTVKYKYKPESITDDGSKPHIGVIAQELRRNFPTLVSEHEAGHLQINPTELVFVLINAVQELNQRIQSLEAQNGIS